MSLATTTVRQHADGVYIWVGPGDAATFPSVKTDNYSRVLLIEANELQQEHLLQLQQTDAKISVLLQAVATEDGPAQLYRYNLSQFNALQPATGLLQLYPGLKLQEQSSVEAINFATLVREQQLAPQDCHTLVLSVPAQALALLLSLAEQQLLTLFSQLTVQTAAIELYQDAGTCQELESWLLLQGYLHAATDNTDPDLVVMTFRRHALLDKIETLVIANGQLTEQLTASKAEQQVLRLQLEQQSQQFNDTAAVAQSQQAELAKLAQTNVALTNNIEQIKTQHSAALQALEAKLQQAEQALTAERQAADKDTTQLQQQIQLLEDKLQSAGSGNAELLLTTQSLTAQKTQAEQANAELQQKLQQAELVATEAQRIAAAETEQIKQQVQLLEEQLQQATSTNAVFVANNESLTAQKTQAEQANAALQQKLQQAELFATEAQRIAAADAEQAKHQIQALEITLKTTSSSNTELAAKAESLALLHAQAEQSMLELQQKLLQAEQLIIDERKSAVAANAEFEKQLQACEQQMQAVKDNSAGLVAKVDSLQNQKVQMDKTVADLQQQLDKHKSDLTTVTKHAATRLEKINQLESTVRRQQEENQQLSARQQALQQEMLKAEAQIDLIKELILKE